MHNKGFKEYDIVNKIFSISFDNASNNTSAIDLFVKKKLERVHKKRCFM